MDSIGGILQHQLATDGAAFAQISIVLETLTPDHLKPSQHTQKWMNRIDSLLHSREPSLRWAGLCLADKTSELSVQLMLEHAEIWVGIVLPVLSRAEVEPIHTMSIRLLFRIFSSATHMNEFQRQVSAPNVSRYASAMVALAEKDIPISLQVIILETLHALVSIYPSMMRTVQAALHKLALRHISGSFPTPTPPEILSPASKLLASLHVSSGKAVGSASWKKTIEGALATSTECLAALRTTFELSTPIANTALEVPKLPADPMIAMPLALDRLRCMIIVVSALLQAETARVVTVPLASIVRLAVDMLKGAPEKALENQDIALHAFQLSLVPSITALGCRLAKVMCEIVGRHLTPYASQLVNAVVFQLAQPNVSVSTRTLLLRTLPPIIYQAHPFQSSILPNRVARSTLKSITALLSDELSNNEITGNGIGPTSYSRGKGKKRARGYEGDEMLRNQPHGSRLEVAQSEEVIAAIDVLEAVVASGFLSQPTLSAVHRVLLSILLSLTQQNPQTFSKDLGAYETFQHKVFDLSARIAQHGNDGFAARSLGTVLSATATLSEGFRTQKARLEIQGCLEGALHPRLPPLLKTLPPIESFPLLRKEETKEEREILDELRLTSTDAAETPSVSRNGIPMVASAVLVQNQSHPHISAPPIPASTSAVLSTAPQPQVLEKGPVYEPTTQPLSVSSFAPLKSTAEKSTSLTGTERHIDSDSGVHQYKRPEWAMPSAIIQTEAPQAPLTPPKEAQGASFHLDMDEDEDDDQLIPQIDMRSDSEDEE